MTKMKTCSKCKEKKPETTEFFPTREKGNFRADCRDCYYAYRESMRDNYTKTNMIKEARNRAKAKGLEFNLNSKNIVWPTHCPILGIKLEHNKGISKDNSYTIDRIDNTRGYTLDIIQIISMIANKIKTNATPEQVYTVGKYMMKSQLDFS